MIFSLTTFTLIHVVLSLIGILAGLVVAGGFASGKLLGRWALVFLVTTVLTSVTGFGFPFVTLLPSHIVGIVSLVVLAGVVVAQYLRHFAGAWRRIYAAGVVLATYFNTFVLVTQLFRRVPALLVSAPTQSEPPFAITQLLVLARFIWLGVAADRVPRRADRGGLKGTSSERCRQTSRREGPGSSSPRPSTEAHDTEQQRTQSKRDHHGRRRGENEDPSQQSDETRHGIEPHPIRPRQVRRPPAQQRHRADLPDELHQNPRRDQCIDHHAQRHEPGEDREDAQHDQRDAGESLGRMEAREDFEEVAVLRRRIRHPRVPEQEGEDRAERGPQDHRRE